MLIGVLFPKTVCAAIEAFYGLGGTMFIGAGAAVLGYSPLVEAIGLINEHADFWVQVGESGWMETCLTYNRLR